MSTPTSRVLETGGRLSDLIAAYAELKPRVDDLSARLKTLSDAIKVELMAANPGTNSIVVVHPALPQPLRLSYVERWDLDAKRLKVEDPETYVRYARKGGSWVLKAVRG